MRINLQVIKQGLSAINSSDPKRRASLQANAYKLQQVLTRLCLGITAPFYLPCSSV